jgi:hypothetical protein
LAPSYLKDYYTWLWKTLTVVTDNVRDTVEH